MSGNRWYSYFDPYGLNDDRPSNHKTIWINRVEWDEPSVVQNSSLHPAMNVIGLWWAPAVDGEGPPVWGDGQRK